MKTERNPEYAGSKFNNLLAKHLKNDNLFGTFKAELKQYFP